MTQDDKATKLREQLWKVRKSDRLFRYVEMARQIDISGTTLYNFMNNYPIKASFETLHKVEKFLKRSKFKEILKG